MKNKNTYFHLIAVLVSFAPLVYLIIYWPSIPDEIPVRYNFDLRPETFAGKSFLWFPSIIVSMLALTIYTILSSIPAWDKRLHNKPGHHLFVRLAFVITIFLSILNFLIIISAGNSIWILERGLIPLISLLFATIGNYFYNIKPNRYAGFRLPWTLSNEVNWRKTHRLGAPIWFWGGIATAVVSLIIPFTYAVTCFIIFLLISLILPLLYSYKLHKNDKNGIA